MTQQGFCPRCGQHGDLHELFKGDGTYRRHRNVYDKPERYCERCIDIIKRQEAVDRKNASIKRFEHEKKYGRPHRVH